ncbi:MAG TPA: putative glycoside hydrolase, partial [Terriglobia bacterium]|nr:putative glycoside hydrolase [Terriglobia bacterium]
TSGDPTYRGTVIDGKTAIPIEGATVTLGGNIAVTDRDGHFNIYGTATLLRVRAPGYLRRDTDGSALGSAPLRIELVPFTPNALYLSFHGIGSAALREPALKLIEETEESRVNTITEFLRRMRQGLIPCNVFLSADVFGYVCWNSGDTGIGQRIEDLAPLLDYVSPMLYPSAFQYGIPGITNPVEHPGEIVSLSLESARRRTGLPAVRLRPWLQAFPDYAFDRRPFNSDEIRVQIDAAETFHSNGCLLWDSQNRYSNIGLAETATSDCILFNRHPHDPETSTLPPLSSPDAYALRNVAL